MSNIKMDGQIFIDRYVSHMKETAGILLQLNPDKTWEIVEITDKNLCDKVVSNLQNRIELGKKKLKRLRKINNIDIETKMIESYTEQLKFIQGFINKEN